MIPKHSVDVEARHLGLIIRALGEIKGPKPIMLSYKFGRILEPVSKLQQEFVAQLAEYVIPETGSLREDLTDQERAKVEELVTENVTFDIPTVTVLDIAEMDITMDDDSVLVYLVETGVFVDDKLDP